MTTTPTRSAVGLRSERGPVLASVMLATSLVALDATIIATAVPSIVRDLGDFSQFPWLFSAYLLAQAVTVPIYGKVADMVGRRPVMLAGIAAFVVGSVLCGVAWSMPALIVARALQGIGAGAVLPMSITIVGDLYSVEERARVQGYVASVWAVSSVIGPALGGLFSDYLSWRWIFFLNLPLGIAAIWMLWRRFHESVTRRRHRLDLAGAALLTAGSSLLILGLLQGGVSWAWSSATGLGVLGAAVLLLGAFVVVERRVAEPVLPPWVFGTRVLNGGNAVSLMVGVVLMGLTTFVPAYVQGVLGTSALVAGAAVAAVTLGWPVAASLSGRLYLRIGFRNTALIGGLLVVLGSGSMLWLGPDSPVLLVALPCLVVGAGLGFSSVPTLVAVQSAVSWDRRGVATGTVMFSRNIGAAVGAALFGAVANAVLAARLAHPDRAQRLLTAGRHRAGASTEGLRDALFAAVHQVFLVTLLTALLLAAAVWLMPRRTPS